MNFRISDRHSAKTSSLKTRCGVEEGLVHAGRGGNVGSKLGPFGPRLNYIGPRLSGMLAYVGAVLADVGAMLDPGRPMLGPSWPLFGAVLWPWAYRWAMLAPCKLVCFWATFAMLSQDNTLDKK